MGKTYEGTGHSYGPHFKHLGGRSYTLWASGDWAKDSESNENVQSFTGLALYTLKAHIFR
jgi:hypothetical protein